MSKIDFCTMFGGEGAEGYNAMMTSLQECAKDDGRSIYDFLEHTPKTSLVVELVDKLRELGFDIVRKP